MDKEKILLDVLNTFGNFTSVEQEFNYNQLEVIYEAMDKAFRQPLVVGRSEQLVCEYCNNNAKPTCCDICLEDMVDSIQNTN